MAHSTPNLPFQPGKLALCLLAAALFWLLNALNQKDYSLNIEYPLQFVYNDSLYVPTTPLPRMVRVNVSGDGWGLLGQSWLDFQAEPLQYTVRNPLQATVINTEALAAELGDVIRNVRVNYVVADTLELGFDRRESKVIRLMTDSLHIKLAPRYVVSSVINVTPNTVTVSGPERLVRGLPDTLRLRIPGKRIEQNFDEEITFNNFRHPQLRASTDKAFVSFEVAELLSPLPTPPAVTTVTSATATSPTSRGPARKKRNRR